MTILHTARPLPKSPQRSPQNTLTRIRLSTRKRTRTQGDQQGRKKVAAKTNPQSIVERDRLHQSYTTTSLSVPASHPGTSPNSASPRSSHRQETLEENLKNVEELGKRRPGRKGQLRSLSAQQRPYRASYPSCHNGSEDTSKRAEVAEARHVGVAR